MVLILLCAQDGGLLINNPTALAVHECKCLWPNTPLECVVSLGTGRFETLGKTSTTYTSLKTKLTNVISSATDTEGKCQSLRSIKRELCNLELSFQDSHLTNLWVCTSVSTFVLL